MGFEKKWHNLSFEEFLDIAAGKIVVGIGKGDWRSQLSLMLQIEEDRGYGARSLAQKWKP